jgi:D-aminoacyl-tRNA deacylase
LNTIIINNLLIDNKSVEPAPPGPNLKPSNGHSMICIIGSTYDKVSSGIMQHIFESISIKNPEVGKQYTSGSLMIYMHDGPLTEFSLEIPEADVLCFVSKHSSAAQKGAITTHATGNWGSDALLGGKPRSLSMSAPLEMLAFLLTSSRAQRGSSEIDVTYEATHHGPLLSKSALFVELGGNNDVASSDHLHIQMAEAILESMDEARSQEYKKVVIGISGTHYPSKFSKLAVEKNYAFSHILPKHHAFDEIGGENLSLLRQAAEKTPIKVDSAVIEWKSFNSVSREKIIKALGEIGLDYERV